MSMWDGVNTLWILRIHNGLDIDGCKDEGEAIDHLIRYALTFKKDPGLKDRIRSIVEEALQHDIEPADRRPASEECDDAP